MKIQIKVVPNSSKNQLVKIDEGYKAYLHSPPIDGKANQALIELLSKEFGVAKSKIQVIKGKTSKNKTVEIQQ